MYTDILPAKTGGDADLADLPPPRRGTGIYTGLPRETRPTTPPPYPRDVRP